MKMEKQALLVCSLVLLLLTACAEMMEDMERVRSERFVDIAEVIPGIALDIRYHTPFNFVGESIEGYLEPRCLLTRAAATALKPVQTELMKQNLSLKIYDCYRPQRAVDHFVRWAEDFSDTRMKAMYYPNVNKKDLFKDGYIAARSGHSRGSTLDLTIVPVPVPSEPDREVGKPFIDNSIDMGTPFDYFDPFSHTGNPTIDAPASANRMLLKCLMENAGFTNLKEEWWHYTLVNEPFPEQYFDFPVQ